MKRYVQYMEDNATVSMGILLMLFIVSTIVVLIYFFDVLAGVVIMLLPFLGVVIKGIVDFIKLTIKFFTGKGE